MNPEFLFEISMTAVFVCFALASFGFFEEWGKIATGEPRPRGQIGYPPSRWKTWREWTWGEVVVSPLMLFGYLGMGIFGIVGMLMFAVFYLLCFNPVAKAFWTMVGNILSTPLTKRFPDQ